MRLIGLILLGVFALVTHAVLCFTLSLLGGSGMMAGGTRVIEYTMEQSLGVDYADRLSQEDAVYERMGARPCRAFSSESDFGGEEGDGENEMVFRKGEGPFLVLQQATKNTKGDSRDAKDGENETASPRGDDDGVLWFRTDSPLKTTRAIDCEAPTASIPAMRDPSPLVVELPPTSWFAFPGWLLAYSICGAVAVTVGITLLVFGRVVPVETPIHGGEARDCSSGVVESRD